MNVNGLDYKILFVFNRRETLIQVWYKKRVSTWLQYIFFGWAFLLSPKYTSVYIYVYDMFKSSSEIRIYELSLCVWATLCIICPSKNSQNIWALVAGCKIGNKTCPPWLVRQMMWSAPHNWNIFASVFITVISFWN